MPSANALAILIPMYNEEPNAEKCVRSVCGVLSEKVPESRLFAINDGSRDRTGEILQGMTTLGLPFTYVAHERNRGYGAAIVTGAKAALEAGYEFGLVMDSDLTNDPALIPLFAEKLKDGKYDLIKASRYIPGGGMKGVPMYRQQVTIWGNRVASLLFGMGIRDCTNGFHAVRLKMICGQEFRERGFPMLLEELLALKRQGARATEIPYTLTSRASDEGASKFSYSWKVIWSYLKYALKASLIRYRVNQ